MNNLKTVENLIGDNLFIRVYNIYGLNMKDFPASIRHHHCESGGYIRHVREVIELSIELATKFNMDQQSIIKLAFIHDLDKLERYEIDPTDPTGAQIKYAKSLGIIILGKDSKSSLSTKIDNVINKMNNPIQYYRYKEKLPADESARVMRICMDLGISLTEDEVHALCYHHGGWSNLKGPMSPMACILHCADLMSSQILGGGV